MQRALQAGKLVPFAGLLALASQVGGDASGGAAEVPSESAASTAAVPAPIAKALRISGGYCVSQLKFASGDARTHVGVVGQRNGWRKVVAETTITNATDAPLSYAMGPLPSGLSAVQGAPFSVSSGSASLRGQSQASVGSGSGAAVSTVVSTADGAADVTDDTDEEEERVDVLPGLKGHLRPRQSAKVQVVVEVAELRSQSAGEVTFVVPIRNLYNPAGGLSWSVAATITAPRLSFERLDQHDHVAPSPAPRPRSPRPHHLTTPSGGSVGEDPRSVGVAASASVGAPASTVGDWSAVDDGVHVSMLRSFAITLPRMAVPSKLVTSHWFRVINVSEASFAMRLGVVTFRGAAEPGAADTAFALGELLTLSVVEHSSGDPLTEASLSPGESLAVRVTVTLSEAAGHAETWARVAALLATAPDRQSEVPPPPVGCPAPGGAGSSGGSGGGGGGGGSSGSSAGSGQR